MKSPFALARPSAATSPLARAAIFGAAVVAALFTLAAGVLASRSLDGAGEAGAWVRHTYTVIATLDGIRNAVADIESAQRGYQLTHDSHYLTPLDRVAEARHAVEVATRLTADNVAQRQRLAGLAAAMERKLAFVDEVLRLNRTGRVDSALALVRAGEGRILMQQFDAELQRSVAAERGLLSLRIDTEAAELAAARRHVVLALAAAGFAALLALAMLRREAANLARAGREAQEAEARAIASEQEAWQAEAHARDSEAHYRLLFESNPVPAWVYDQQTLRFLAVNPAACRQYGFTAEEFLRMSLVDLRPPEDARAVELWAASARGQARMESEGEHRTRDGRLVTVALSSHALRYQGRSARLVLAHDVTELRRAQAALEELAVRDELTGLLNRRGFRQFAEQELKVARRSGRADVVLYFDLDGFKAVNDAWGHAEGDAALRAVADVLRGTLREGDIVARLGGDEFAVYAPGLARHGEGQLVAARVVAAVRDHFAAAQSAGTRAYHLGTSVGLAEMMPGDDLDALLARADESLYAQKTARRRAA